MRFVIQDKFLPPICYCFAIRWMKLIPYEICRSRYFIRDFSVNRRFIVLSDHVIRRGCFVWEIWQTPYTNGHSVFLPGSALWRMMWSYARLENIFHSKTSCIEHELPCERKLSRFVSYCFHTNVQNAKRTFTISFSSNFRRMSLYADQNNDNALLLK